MALKMAIVFMLLAMAATITHARLDLFQMPFSKNQQPNNHGGTEMAAKLESVAASEWLPYPECIKLCDSCPICTLPYPIELALCLCVNNTATHKQPQLLPPSKIQTSGVVEEEVIKVDSRGNSDLMGSGEMTWPGGIPYPICIQICKQCACTLIYPVEYAICICLDKHPSKSRPLEIK